MAFPTTSVLDSFTRANGGLGAAWTSPVLSGDSTPTISSNVVIGPSGLFSSSYWNAGTFNDSECYLTIPAGSTSFSQTTLYLRLSSPGGGSSTCYYVQFDASGGIDIVRVAAGSSSGSLSHIATNAAAGWKIGAAAKTSGNDVTIEVWADSGSGWTMLGSYTNTGVLSGTPALASGYVGFQLFGNNATTRSIDDFGGGTVGTLGSTPQVMLPMGMLGTRRV